MQLFAFYHKISIAYIMTKQDLKIVFMGTSEFAVESLRALVEGGYSIVGVVTMPDKPMGRHRSVLQLSTVKQYALSQNIPILQPENIRSLHPQSSVPQRPIRHEQFHRKQRHHRQQYIPPEIGRAHV